MTSFLPTIHWWFTSLFAYMWQMPLVILHRRPDGKYIHTPLILRIGLYRVYWMAYWIRWTFGIRSTKRIWTEYRNNAPLVLWRRSIPLSPNSLSLIVHADTKFLEMENLTVQVYYFCCCREWRINSVPDLKQCQMLSRHFRYNKFANNGDSYGYWTTRIYRFS